MVIPEDEVESQVGRWAGLPLQLPLKDTMVCVQYLLAGIDIDPECNYFWIGHKIAPGGYAWVFPKGEGRANVGLGVQADLWESIASHISKETPRKSPSSSMNSYGIRAPVVRINEIIGCEASSAPWRGLTKDSFMLLPWQQAGN